MVEKVTKLVTVDDEVLDFIWQPLHKAGYGNGENELVRAINENRSKRIVYYAVLGLRKKGSKKSVPLLESLIDYPYEDVKTTAVLSVAALAGAESTEFLMRLIGSEEYHIKAYPLAALYEVGDDRAWNMLLKIAEAIASKGQLPKYWDWDDLPYLQAYLLKWSKSEKIVLLDKTLDEIYVRNKWPLLKRVVYKITKNK